MSRQKKKKTGKRKKHIFRKIIITLIVLLILVAAGYYAWSSLKNQYTVTYDEYTANRGTISNSLSFSGSLQLVDSKEYTSETGNVSVRNVYVAPGDKVAKGEAIYRYSLENEEAINQKISELDLKIQDAMKRETTFFSTDIKLLESQIETQLEKVYESTNIQEVETYKKNISNLVTKKAKVAGELSPSDSYIKECSESVDDIYFSVQCLTIQVKFDIVFIIEFWFS